MSGIRNPSILLVLASLCLAQTSMGAELSQDDLRRLLVTGLREREEKLRSVHLEFTETGTYQDDRGQSPSPAKASTFSRSPEGFVYRTKLGLPNGSWSERVRAWHGKYGREWSHNEVMKQPQGRLRLQKPQGLEKEAFLEQAGLYKMGEDSSFADWLERMLRQKEVRTTLGTAAADKTLWVQMEVPGKRELRYTFDMSRSFLMSGFEEHYESDGAKTRLIFRITTETQNVDGVHLPLNVRSETYFAPRRWSTTFTLTRTSIPADKAAVVFTFPAGTLVHDGIETTGYVVSSDGGKQYVPVVDPRTGKQIVGPEPTTAPASQPAVMQEHR